MANIDKARAACAAARASYQIASRVADAAFAAYEATHTAAAAATYSAADDAATEAERVLDAALDVLEAAARAAGVVCVATGPGWPEREVERAWVVYYRPDGSRYGGHCVGRYGASCR